MSPKWNQTRDLLVTLLVGAGVIALISSIGRDENFLHTFAYVVTGLLSVTAGVVGTVFLVPLLFYKTSFADSGGVLFLTWIAALFVGAPLAATAAFKVLDSFFK
jgi:hypothetical protein